MLGHGMPGGPAAWGGGGGGETGTIPSLGDLVDLGEQVLKVQGSTHSNWWQRGPNWWQRSPTRHGSHGFNFTTDHVLLTEPMVALIKLK